MAYSLDTLKWEGNSRLMCESILREVPPFFRGGVQRSIADWLGKNSLATVTEDDVFRAVRDISPRNLAENRILPELEKLRTNPRER